MSEFSDQPRSDKPSAVQCETPTSPPAVLNRQVADLQQLHETTMRVARAAHGQAAAQEVLRAALTAIDAKQGLLSVCDVGGRVLTIGASQGFPATFLEKFKTFDAGCGPCGTALRRRERVLVADARTDPIFSDCPDAVNLGAFASCHSVPLVTFGGEAIGVISVFFGERHAADEREKWLLDLYAQMAANLLERTRAAEALRLSEQRFRKLANQAPVGIFFSDAEGRCHFVNETWCEIAGISAEQAMGEGWMSVLHPEDRERVTHDWQQAVRDGKPSNIEFRFLRPDGTVRWLHGSAVRVEYTGYIGTIADITNRKAVEHDLGRLAAIVETSEDAIITKDLNGVITTWNAAATRLFGYTAAEAVGRLVTMLIPADRRDEEPGILHRIRAGDRIEHYTTVRQRKDDSLVDISLSVSPLLDGKGRIIGASKIARDISASKRADAALRRSEEQLRLVTDSAMVFLAQCDREYRLKFVNRPFAQRFGRKPEELVGRSVAEVIGLEAFAAIKPRIDEALRGQRVEFETQLSYERVGLRWVRVVHEPERASDGEIVGLVAVIMDITARKETERDMEAARDKALAASRAKDDFLAALSHELRTPLNPVLLIASEGANDAALPEPVRADFATIRKNVELEARLIDDLLDLTRITRGKLSLNLGVQDIHAVLNDAIATMRGEFDAKHLSLSCDLAATDAMVWGDAVRLQQVLWNVLKNAVKFTPEGGEVFVRTCDAPDKEHAIIEVRDTGIGMTEPERARAFDAFSQGDHARASGPHRFGGVGLGLTISRMLVELHRGRIEAQSEGRGRGSSFSIELPVVGRDERESTDARVMRPPTRTPFRGEAGEGENSLRLLLVEDHEPTRAALAQLLKRRNYCVSAAGSVAEARALADKEKIDLVLSDVGLPDGTGYELMSELRSRHKLVGIALTGYGMDHDVVRSQAAGFLVHLTKPVTIQSLDRALAAAIAVKATRS